MAKGRFGLLWRHVRVEWCSILQTLVDFRLYRSGSRPIALLGAARAGAAGFRQADQPQPSVSEAAVTTAESVPTAKLQPSAAAGPYFVRLPLLYLNYTPPLSYRLGFSGAEGSFSQYPEVATLKTGWNSGYWVSAQPQRPDGH